MEFLMWNDVVTDKWFHDASKYAKALWDLLPPKIRAAAAKTLLKILLISSWKPGMLDDRIAVTPAINECAVGPKRWMNTLNFAAVGASDPFSDNNTAAQWAHGRDDVLYPKLDVMFGAEESCPVFLIPTQSSLTKIQIANTKQPTNCWSRSTSWWNSHVSIPSTH